MPQARAITIGQLRIDALEPHSVLDAVSGMVEARGGTLFTPNVHHVALAERDAAFACVYGRAGLSVCDGKPLQWVARPQGGLPACLPGSRLLPLLLRHAAQRRWPVYFVGGRQGVAQRLPALLASQYAGLHNAGISAPTRQLMTHSPEALAQVADAIVRHKPALVCVSLTSPLQEIWADAVHQRCGHSVFVCTGSAIDRVAGMAHEAPLWLGKVGLEWAWRIGQEPMRLAPRYAVDAVTFAPIAWRAWRKGGASGSR